MVGRHRLAAPNAVLHDVYVTSRDLTSNARGTNTVHHDREEMATVRVTEGLLAIKRSNRSSRS
jgi:hypothetical protein